MNEMISNHFKLSNFLREQREGFLKKDLGVPREILVKIEQCLRSPQILVISGLRRSGKSTLQAQIATHYLKDDFYYLNFEDERWAGFEAKDFQVIHETLIQTYGEKKFFLLDEVQNISGWEAFVRRLHDEGYRFIITGSNAALLSAELGARLTGRHQVIELFPFSFKEYLVFKGVQIPQNTNSPQLRSLFDQYLYLGGVPDALKYEQPDFLAQLYQDIIYRDIASRYSVDSLKSLREMALYLISNISRPVSFNKLKQQLMLGSVNTVKNYVEYLEASWLFFTVNAYSRSVKQQQIAHKKIYCIDNGMVKAVGFSDSEDVGWLLENLVFLHLRKIHGEVFYHKNSKGSETDFLIRIKNKPKLLFQACLDLSSKETYTRETQALLQSMEDLQIPEGHIITLKEKDLVNLEDKKIHVVPACEFFV